MIQMFKVINNLEEINWVNNITFVRNAQTRRLCNSINNNQAIERELFDSRRSNDFRHWVTVRHNFFLNNVTEHWNKLSNDIVSASTVNSFKSRYDKYRESAAIAQQSS